MPNPQLLCLTPVVALFASGLLSAQNTLYISGGGNSVQINNSHVVHSDGDLNILSSATLVLGSTGEPNLEVDGHVDNATDATFTAGTGLLELTGSSNQNIDMGGDDLYNLEIVNSAGATITDPVTVNNEVQFNTGDITTDATNFITFETTASSAGEANASHVVGPVAKNFNSTSTFTFPIGDGTSLNTLGFTPDGTGATTMKASYSFTEPASRSSKDAGIIKVSFVEQWTLTRESGSEDGAVTLEWDASSGVTTHTDLIVAGWDGTKWANIGGATHTGNATAGTVKSNSTSAFSAFTLGSTTTVNALPVELVEFTARSIGDDEVVLKWITAAEINNNYFAIERSSNGVDFESIDSVSSYGNGFSTDLQSYGYVDNNPIKGTSYYRLRQVDFDGTYDYSNVQIVNFDGFEIVDMYPNPSNGEVILVINSSQASTVQIEIFDAIGQVVNSQQIEIFEGSNQLKNFINGARGKYFVSVTTSKGEHFGYPLMVIK